MKAGRCVKRRIARPWRLAADQERAMQLSRRTVLTGLAGSAALASPTILRAQTRELVMVGYGNEQDLPLIRAGEELGRRHPGVSVQVIGGLSAEALAQIKAARGNSPYDLAVMGTPAIINAIDEDVIEPLDLSLIPTRPTSTSACRPTGWASAARSSSRGSGSPTIPTWSTRPLPPGRRCGGRSSPAASACAGRSRTSASASSPRPARRSAIRRATSNSR
jgi:hypothetical protein